MSMFFSFIINCNAACRANKVYEIVSDAVTNEKAVTAPLVFNQEFTMGGYPVCLDYISDDNTIGIAKKFIDEKGNEASDEDIQRLFKRPYKIDLIGMKGIKILANVEEQVLSNKPAETVAEEEPENALPTSFDAYNELPARIRQRLQEIVDEGISTKENLVKVLEYLKSQYCRGRNGLSNTFLVERIFNEYRKYERPCVEPETLYQDPDKYSPDAQSRMLEALEMAVCRDGCNYVGPKSLGKNVFFETLAWVLGKPKYIITFSAQMAPSDVFGEKSSDNTASDILAHFDSEWLEKAKMVHHKHQKTVLNRIAANVLSQILHKKYAVDEDVYTDEEKEVLRKEAEFEKLKAEAASIHIKMDPSELYDWLIDGGVIMFNEINLANANFLSSFLNVLLDGTGCLFMPGRGNVPINKDCVFTASMNRGYEGTESLNEATESRMAEIRFTYSDTAKEQLRASVNSKLKKLGVGEINDMYLDQASNFYARCKMLNDPSMDNSGAGVGVISDKALNIRGLVRALKEVAVFGYQGSLHDKIMEHIVNSCEDDYDMLVAALNETVTL